MELIGGLDAVHLGRLTVDISDTVALVAPDGRIAFVNAACERVLERTVHELVGLAFLDLVSTKDRDRVAYALKAAPTIDDPATLNFEALVHEGEPVQLKSVVRALDSKKNAGWLSVTIRRRSGTVKELHTRGFFHARIQEAIERAAADEGYRFAVIIMTINQTKLIERGAGPEHVQQLVTDVGLRLKTQLGARDSVARLDESELGVLLEAPGAALSVDEVAEYCQRCLTRPFKVAGQEMTVTASSGIVLSKPRYRQASEIIADAGSAKQRALKFGGGSARAELFRTSIGREDQRRFRLAVDLPRAIQQGGLSVRYQPLVSLETNRIAGVEALCRWPHPELGMISPVEFIALAEEVGIIAGLDRWVLRRACEDAMAWEGEKPFVSCNVSALQLQDSSVVESVAKVLEATQFPPRLLHLEVTESAVAENAETARITLLDLKTFGVHIALDDFGTGYSSFAYLADLPLDSLKIDRTFVSRMHIEGACEGIVHGVIAMANRLGLMVVAEGIEEPEQLAILRDMGCDIGQGFLFSKPVTNDEFIALRATPPDWSFKEAFTEETTSPGIDPSSDKSAVPELPTVSESPILIIPESRTTPGQFVITDDEE